MFEIITTISVILLALTYKICIQKTEHFYHPRDIFPDLEWLEPIDFKDRSNLKLIKNIETLDIDEDYIEEMDLDDSVFYAFYKEEGTSQFKIVVENKEYNTSIKKWVLVDGKNKILLVNDDKIVPAKITYITLNKNSSYSRRNAV